MTELDFKIFQQKEVKKKKKKSMKSFAYKRPVIIYRHGQ